GLFRKPAGSSRRELGSKAMLPLAIRKVLYRLPERLMLRLGRRFSVEGMKLVIFEKDRDQVGQIREKVISALRLVQNHSPKCFARIEKFIPNILIFNTYGRNATYVSDLKLCRIGTD